MPPEPVAEEPEEPDVADPTGDGGEDGGVPLYLFLDPGAVAEMLAAEDRLFSFRGLLNLCRQGHMKCLPPADVSVPQWMGPVEERDRVLLVITDSVLEELGRAGDSPRARQLDAQLEVFQEWGVLEVLDTVFHKQLMTLNAEQEQRAKEMGISHEALKMLDWVSLWQSQIDSERRVLLVTADTALSRYSSQEVELLCPQAQHAFPVVLHIDEFSRRLAEDVIYGGQLLCGVAGHGERTERFCGAVLSASLITGIALPVAVCSDSGAAEGPSEDDAGDHQADEAEPGALAAAAASHADSPEDEVEALRQELREAVSMVATARRLLSSVSSGRRGRHGRRGGAAKATLRQEEVASLLELIGAREGKWRHMTDAFPRGDASTGSAWPNTIQLQ